jgi:hypothetical protein
MEQASTRPTILEEISLRLEHYDDIFSDFDIRPYAKRALSVDFLDEIRRAVRDKNGHGIELLLHVPERDRDKLQEIIINERLASHFKRHHHLLLDEKHRMLKLGFGMVALGVVFMILATLIIFKDPAHSIFLSFLVVFLEPAAWFLLWEGMDQVIFNSKKINPELDFYRKMSHAHGHILFKDSTNA